MSRVSLLILIMFFLFSCDDEATDSCRLTGFSYNIDNNPNFETTIDLYRNVFGSIVKINFDRPVYEIRYDSKKIKSMKYLSPYEDVSDILYTFSYTKTQTTIESKILDFFRWGV